MVLLMAGTAQAEVIMPKGCRPLPLDGQAVVLKAAKPSLFFIYNKGETDLWITHPVQDPSASAGWSSRIQAGNWSSLLLSLKTFELSCVESKPGHEHQIPCAPVLAICQFPQAKFPQKDRDGSFWVGENMSLKALETHVEARGFVLQKEPMYKGTN